MRTLKLILSGWQSVGLVVFFMLFFNMEVSGKGKITKNAPVFTQFIYQGEDAIYQNNPLKPGEFYNPILQGCYPDPSITRKGNDYYLVCSSFAMFPGVPIFHSNDLVNWKQIGHVLDRTSQLKVEDCGISAGVYAPAIRYNPNNDTFYMITTQFSGGFGNMVVKTKNPENGWSDPIKLQFDYKKDGRYYLMCAEGGTGGWHSEVIFVSDHPKGPYLPSNNNPILTQRYFPANRADKVDWAGHADLVEGPDGKYYGVFLGIRPNEKNRVNTGRETFILPVDWSGTFPVFENGLIPMKPTLKMPSGVENQTGKNGYLPSGNFVFKDDFSDKTLDFRWIGLRGPREEFVEMTDKGLRIIPFTSNINEVKPTSTLFYRQQHNQFTAAATMEYKPKNEKDFAGITCYQNERYHYVFGITKKGKDYYLILQRTEKGQASVLGEVKIETEKPVTLQVTANGDDYRFNYSIDGKGFLNLGGTVSGDILSTNEAGGFTGAMIGLYATSVGY